APGASVSTRASASPARTTQITVPACHSVSSGAEEAGGAWRLLEEVMQGRCPFGCLDGRPVVTSATHAPEPAVRPGSAGCPRCPGLGYAVHMGSGMPIIQQTVDPRRGRGLPRRGTGFSLIELMVVVAV